jgi:hypothetical protein
MKLMTQFQAQIPHPLADHLPKLLAPRRMTTPAVGVLFHVLIGEHGFERATMEVESQHKSLRESALWQHGKEEFVDDSFTGASDATLGRSGGMSGNHDPAPGALWGDDQLRTIVEQTCCSAFRMDGLLSLSEAGGEPGLLPDQGGCSLCRASQRAGLPDHQ